MLPLVMHAGLADREAQTLILSESKNQGRQFLLPPSVRLHRQESGEGPRLCRSLAYDYCSHSASSSCSSLLLTVLAILSM